jgi:hypothetical protein
VKLNEVVENFGYALGDAEDFIDRNEADFCDLIDKVAFGRLSSSEAKRVVREAFMGARRDLNQWKTMRATAARKYGYSHLHESLAFMETVPVGRVVIRLPIPDEVA